jgi:hypothetical protein
MEAMAIDPRMQRGAALAKAKGSAIKAIVGAKYLVPSATHSGAYVVDATERSCTCPDFLSFSVSDGHVGGHQCKHLYAVLIIREEITLPNGISVVTEQKVRFKYPRDWPVINAALVDLPRAAPFLIADMVKSIPVEPRPAGKRGPDFFPIHDVVFAALVRTFTNSTARGVVAAVEGFNAQGLCEGVPHYNTLLRRLADPKMMAVMQQVLGISAAPLAAIEDDRLAQYAIDSTGFSTSLCADWNTHKHGTPNTHTRKARWVKAHVFLGTRTHGIMAVTPTEATGLGTGDSPNFVPLLRRAIQNGAHPLEVSADAAYPSAENIGATEYIGAKPFFAWRSNMNGATSPLIKGMLDRAAADKLLWEEHYHRRSNAESVMFMVKERFGGYLVSRLPRTQYVEIVLKAIAHNIACLVYAMHRHGIAPHFWALAKHLSPSTPAFVLPQIPALIHSVAEMRQ